MADAAYLKREVADALVKGLASVVSGEPEDPVEHLGSFLLEYVSAAQREAAVSRAAAAPCRARPACCCLKHTYIK